MYIICDCVYMSRLGIPDYALVKKQIAGREVVSLCVALPELTSVGRTLRYFSANIAWSKTKVSPSN